MEPRVILIAVEIDFPSGRVVIVLDKQIVMNGNVLFAEKHRYEVPADVTMPDGLAGLATAMSLNGWPNISSQDRATLLNVTNAARGTQDQSPIQQL